MTVKLPGYPEISPIGLELVAVIRDTIVDIESTESKLAKYFKLLIFTFLTSLTFFVGFVITLALPLYYIPKALFKKVFSNAKSPQ